MSTARDEGTTIRPAREDDLKAAGALGAKLARAHHQWDPRRFFVVEEMAAGYAWWLGKERKSRAAVVLVAERKGRVVGYSYGRIEPRNWSSLRNECGMVIDLFVEPRARQRGLGRALLDAMVGALRDKGARQVVLEVASRNERGQRLFAAAGFRPTLIEMTMELPGKTRARGGRTGKVE